MLQTDFLRPDAMPIRLEQTHFLLMLEDDVGRENMPGGKPVIVDLRNQERAPRRAAEDQIGALGPRSETP